MTVTSRPRTSREVARDTAIQNLSTLFDGQPKPERRAAAEQKLSDAFSFLTDRLGKDSVMAEQELMRAFATPEGVRQFLSKNKGYGL